MIIIISVSDNCGYFVDLFFHLPSILSHRMWKPSSLQISKMIPFFGLLSKKLSLLLPSWWGAEAAGNVPDPSAAVGLSFSTIFPAMTGTSDVFFRPCTLAKRWSSVIQDGKSKIAKYIVYIKSFIPFIGLLCWPTSVHGFSRYKVFWTVWKNTGKA